MQNIANEEKLIKNNFLLKKLKRKYLIILFILNFLKFIVDKNNKILNI